MAAILAALLVFRIRVAPEDARPHFGDQEVDTQVYVVGDEIELKLPTATRANGPLIYTLYPKVPGITLSGTILHGTPSAPGTYSMIYTVVDSDDDTTGSDKDWLTFTILVEWPRSGVSGELGEDVNAIDDEGTVLCKAARHAGHAEVKTLLDRGADPNLHPAGRHEIHPISCALASEKPLTEIRLIMQALADGGAVIPDDGIAVVRVHLDPEDMFSLLRPFLEATR